MGSILSMVFSALSGPILDKLIAPLTHIFDQYMNKVITEAQLREQIQALLLSTFKDIEVAHADALKSTYASFMTVMGQNKLVQQVWGYVVISQATMIIWFQFGIPITVLIVRIWVPDFKFPTSGSTADWSYLLVAACLGMAPVVLRSGPGAGTLMDKLKALVGK